MLLNWRLHTNPIVNAASPVLLDFSDTAMEFSQARFATFAQGGYGDAGLAFQNPSNESVRDAAENWLMRRVFATDAQGRSVYEGFVAGVRASMGHHIYLRSMEQFANVVVGTFQWAGSYTGYGKCPKGKTCPGRQYAYETDVDAYGEDDPYGANKVGTTMDLLGIKEEWIQVGTGKISPVQALVTAKVKLRELLRKRGVDIDTAQVQPNHIELILWGYYSTLKWRKQTVGYKKYVEIADIVRACLTAGNRAPFISTDRSNITDTGRTTLFNPSHEPMWLQDQIQQAIVEGDVDGKQLYFQIWDDRKPYLAARATTPRYFSRSDDDRLFDASRYPVPDYLIHAGGEIVAENMDTGIDRYQDVLSRPYRGRIERTEYDDLREKVSLPAPSDVQITDERLLARAHALLLRP